MSTSQSTTVAVARGGSENDDTQVLPVISGPAAAPANAGEGHGPDRFRRDVAGLRAVAVGLVLLYHAGLPFLPGGFVGVDVFFVISGFLITTQLVNEVDRTGRVSLAGFWARRAKRILPAAAVVLVAAAGATRLLLPRTEWQATGGDIVSAATYFINWRLADRAVDYLARDSTPSAVQHFWSLAVEEQFYLVWPLLVVAAVVLARVLKRGNVRAVIGLGLILVAVPSFAWSIIETAASPERAFFVSTTRMWELSIGAGLALVAGHFARLPRAAARVVGWAGLAAVVASGVLLTAHTAWPGYAAALPTLGAAAVIAAGPAAGSGGPVVLLGTGPFRWIGDLSYSLYLWHWPMIVIATVYWDGLSLTRGLLVVAASLIPAWLSYKLIENPLRYSRAVSKSPKLALSLGGNLTLVGVAAGLVLALFGAGLVAGPTAIASGPAPGAAVLPAAISAERALTMRDKFDYIVPDPLVAARDVPDSASGCFQNADSVNVLWCTYGVPAGKTRVALVGDSKMDQWLPAFQLLAAQNNWKVDIAFKAACPFTSAMPLTGDNPDTPYTSCAEWNRSLLAKLVGEKYDYVFTSHGLSLAADGAGKGSAEAMAEGMRASWSALADAGSKVVLIANNPHPGMNVMQCADKNRKLLAPCSFPRDKHTQDPSFKTQQLAASGAKDVPLIDLFDFLCPTVQCPAVIGNALIYRGGSHITATYIKSLTPRLATALSAVGVKVAYTAA